MPLKRGTFLRLRGKGRNGDSNGKGKKLSSISSSKEKLFDHDVGKKTAFRWVYRDAERKRSEMTSCARGKMDVCGKGGGFHQPQFKEDLLTTRLRRLALAKP